MVYPDCSSVRSSGTKTLQLRVRCINSAVAGNISVSIADPNSTVDIVFDVVEEKTIPIQVNTRYLTIEDGYILYSTAASSETVTLTGPSSELAGVASCTAEVSYGDPLSDSVTVETTPPLLQRDRAGGLLPVRHPGPQLGGCDPDRLQNGGTAGQCTICKYAPQL